MSEVEDPGTKDSPPVSAASSSDSCNRTQGGKICMGSEAMPRWRKSPIVVIVLGMAGSGKTTFMQRLAIQSKSMGLRTYHINLDPAVTQAPPFGASIDIRDTVNYSEVMKQYGLGPNGGITTSLNLFATRFDQVLDLLERRADDLDYVYVDTPGQIEVFTWSASGQIISDSLASSFPTVLAYIVDAPRTAHPTTFMSNMLYACSVLYKSRLPMVLTFNKTDIMPAAFAFEWMENFDSFQDALDKYSDEESYMGSLNRSLSLVLDEFYSTLRHVSLSAATGSGVDSFFSALDEAADEFEREYLPELQRRMERVRNRKLKSQEQNLERVMSDIALESKERGGDASSPQTASCQSVPEETELETNNL